GVAVHEFAAAGFPLLLSDQVGAASSFLDEGKNGFSFPAGDAGAIEKIVEKISRLPDEELLKMGEKSLELANTITTSGWAKTLFELIHSR
ncbi:MAG TPA: glycosyl transferase family 1, partial [Bacteroidia bacterium]|nr:glycosyl transferase family 1 [Bacteroidia bacterium]